MHPVRVQTKVLCSLAKYISFGFPGLACLYLSFAQCTVAFAMLFFLPILLPAYDKSFTPPLAPALVLASNKADPRLSPADLRIPNTDANMTSHVSPQMRVKINNKRHGVSSSSLYAIALRCRRTLPSSSCLESATMSGTRPRLSSTV